MYVENLDEVLPVALTKLPKMRKRITSYLLEPR